MLIILHKTGPLAGAEQRVDPRSDRITFGRDPTACDVVYPPNATAIAQHHFALVRNFSGEWTFDLFGDSFVAVDGRAVEMGAVLHSGQTIELGCRGGPSVEVIFGQDALQHMLLPQERAHSQVQAPSLGQLITEAVAAVGSVAIAATTRIKKVLADRKQGGRSPEPAGRPEKANRATNTSKMYSDSDIVEISAFGPTAAQRGTAILFQIFLHRSDAGSTIIALARESDPDTARRGVAALDCEIKIGQRVDIILEAPGLIVGHPAQFLIWQGESRSCQFLVNVPLEAGFRPHFLSSRVLIDSVVIGRLTFSLQIVDVLDPKVASPRSHDGKAWPFNYAFVSYASADRLEVLKRAQGWRAAKIDFFQDLLSLDPGERWERRLFSEIDRCDVFFLFWSSNAAKSEWVLRETEYALNRQKESADEKPFIQPIVLEGPPPPQPPEPLRHIHFNDELRYVMAAIESQSKGATEKPF